MTEPTFDDALVEAVARVLLVRKNFRIGVTDDKLWSSIVERYRRDEGAYYIHDAFDDARAALAVAVPVIREQCAKVAETHCLQTDIERRVERKRDGAEWKVHNSAKAIAAVIRQGQDGEQT